MRAKLANLNHCAVPLLSRADVNLSWCDSKYVIILYNIKPLEPKIWILGESIQFLFDSVLLLAKYVGYVEKRKFLSFREVL